MFRRRASAPTFHPGLVELRDVFGPSDAERVGAELGREPHFAADLLRIRPWLDPQTPGRDLPRLILESQWSGLITLLHERGPWVYAASVRDLQRLSAAYSHLLRGIGTIAEGSSLSERSLLARLGAPQDPLLSQREVDFWDEAAAQARSAYDAWQNRRR